MTTRNLVMTVHPSLGGLDLTADPTIIDPAMLLQAENIEYLEGGQKTKRLGSLQYSPSSSTAGTFVNVMGSSGQNVKALADVWVYNPPNPDPQQTLIAATGDQIYRSTGNGLWGAVGPFGTNGVLSCNVTLAGSGAVISDGRSAPVLFNPLTSALEQATTGSLWPRFEGSIYHLNRLWMAGMSTEPSQIRASAADNIFDSTGLDSFFAQINPGDGDRIIGVSRPYYGSFYIFKGPTFGSVHQFSGATPITFSLTEFLRGAPALSQGGIITTPTDIYWISAYGVHSLLATQKYGNVEEAFLSLPIQVLWRRPDIGLVKHDLTNAKGFWNPYRNIVGWIVTASGVGKRSWVLVYNYALSDPSPGGKKFWSIWKYPYGLCSATMIYTPVGPFQSPTVGEPHLYWGSDQGLAYLAEYHNYDDDGVAYTDITQTPHLTRFPAAGGTIPETQEKQYTGVVTYFQPTDASGVATLTVNIDGRLQTKTIDMRVTGDVLGTPGDPPGSPIFTLDLSELGGGGLGVDEAIIEDRGRSCTLTWEQDTLDADMQLLGYSLRFAAAEPEAKEILGGNG